MAEQAATRALQRAEDAGTSAARILSDVFAPAVSVFLICVLVGAASGSDRLVGTGWGVFAGVFCAVIPMTVIHAAVRRERLTDRHVTRREQRWWVFLVCAGSVLCAITTTALLDGPTRLVWILLTMIAGLLVAGGVTLFGPKVSMHAFCFTALVVLAALLLTPWWLLAFPLLFPLVAFARLRLRHHTPLELVLGVLLATAVMLIAGMFVPVAA